MHNAPGVLSRFSLNCVNSQLFDSVRGKSAIVTGLSNAIMCDFEIECVYPLHLKLKDTLANEISLIKKNPRKVLGQTAVHGRDNSGQERKVADRF